MHTQLDNQILTYLMRVYNNMAHPHHPDPKNVRWWIDRCSAKRSGSFVVLIWALLLRRATRQMSGILG